MTSSAAVHLERITYLARQINQCPARSEIELRAILALERVAHLERIARLAAEGSPMLPIALAEFQRCASGAESARHKSPTNVGSPGGLIHDV